MGNIWSQMYPPAPVFTEKELGDLKGKVLVITGGYSGVGYELTKIVYAKNATVYVAGRSKEKGIKAISEIKAAIPDSTGRLEFLLLDLGDLTTIKKTVEEFLSKEQRLDVLWNNAGVMVPPKGSKTAQGYEMQLGTNCLGPFLLTQLLLPILRQTTKSSPPNTVRVAWAGSMAIDVRSPKGGIQWSDINNEKNTNTQPAVYGQSKAGNLYLAAEMANRTKGDGILSVCFNPGNLKTELQRHVTGVQAFLTNLILHPPIYGAYTELYAGLSPDLTEAHNGAYILPWGRVGTARADVMKGAKSEQEGGTGDAKKFWEYCEVETEKYI